MLSIKSVKFLKFNLYTTIHTNLFTLFKQLTNMYMYLDIV